MSDPEILALKQRVADLETLIKHSPGMRSVYVGEQTLFIRLDGGRRIYIDSRDSVIAPQLQTLGHWERDNTGIVRRLLKPGMRFVDIGANCGYFTLLAGSIVGEGGKVIAFEPQPRVFDLLNRSLRANGYVLRTVVHNVALGDHDHTARFRFRDGDFGGGSLHISDSRARAEHFSELDVPVRRADDLLRAHAPVDFIKIDAEGAEVAIIDGLSQTMAASPKLHILMEFNPGYINKHRKVTDFCAQLAALGFSPYPVTDSNPKKVSWESLLEVGGHGYVLFSRHGN